MTVQADLLDGRPLKILTIDGGGLQALSTLSILGQICNEIARSKRLPRSPAPYQLFDLICGIGTGGWLAMLLGRYRLDIVAAMIVYMDIAEAIEPKRKRERAASKYKFHSRLDQHKLVAKIEEILEKKNLDPMLFDRNREARIYKGDVRCHYAFAAGAIDHQDPENREYQIFRTYEPKSVVAAKPRHAGPVPTICRMSWACAATGAAKSLLQPYPIGATTFFDSRFPKPHNITDLAIDEAYDLYGDKYPISMILNVGPGIPSAHDVLMLSKASRTFSWPNKSNLLPWFCKSPNKDTHASRVQRHMQDEALAPPRANTNESSGSEAERLFEEKVRKRLEIDFGDEDIYVRIAPLVSSENLSVNDVSVMDQSNDAMDRFLGNQETKEMIEQAVKRYLLVPAAAAA